MARSFTGSVANLNIYFSTAGKVSYQGESNANGTVSLSMTTVDQAGNSTSSSSSIPLTAINDAPVRSSGNLPTFTAVNEDSANTTAASLGLSGVTYGVGGASDEASQLLSYKITSIPTFMTLFKTDGSTAVTADTLLTLAELQGLKYKTVANGFGTGNITWTVQDNGGTSNGGADTLSESLVAVTVNSVNDAPSGTNAFVNMLTAATKTFSAADFGFADANDSPANSLANVIITTLPSVGSLKLSGVDVTLNQSITVASLGNLTYAAANGAAVSSNYASIGFKVQDNGGVTNGGVDTSASANTLTIRLTATGTTNTAPTSTGATIALNEDVSKTFAASDFNFADTNSNTLLNVIIVSLPGSTAGVLRLNGAAVTAGQVIPVGSLGSLLFTPVSNYSGSASFTYRVQDNGGGTDTSALATANITVSSSNDAPYATSSTVNIAPSSSTKVFSASDFGFSDVSDAPSANTLLNVTVTSLNAANTGNLTWNNGSADVAVTAYQVITIADIAAGKLKFTPNSAAALGTIASFNFKLQDNGGTANGGVDTSIAAASFKLIYTNPAPSLDLNGAAPGTGLNTASNSSAASLSTGVALTSSAVVLDGAGTTTGGMPTVNLAITLPTSNNGADEVLRVGTTDLSITSAANATVNGWDFARSGSGRNYSFVFSKAGATAAEAQALINSMSYKDTAASASVLAGDRGFSFSLLDSATSANPSNSAVAKVNVGAATGGTFAISDAAVFEPNSSSTTLRYLVTRDVDTSSSATVNYSIRTTVATGSSATTAQGDILIPVGSTGSLSFAAGETSKWIEVTVNGDQRAQNNQSVQVDLTSASAGTIIRSRGKGVISEVDASLAQGAYDLRNINPDIYSGPDIRVRRSSDSREIDIGFDANGNLDVAAVRAFVGNSATDQGYVTVWYDQSGKGNHMRSADGVVGNLPQIVVNGSLVTMASSSVQAGIKLTNSQKLIADVPDCNVSALYVYNSYELGSLAGNQYNWVLTPEGYLGANDNRVVAHYSWGGGAGGFLDLGNGSKEFVRVGQASYGLANTLTTNTFYESVIQMDASLASNNSAWFLNGSNATNIPNGLYGSGYGGATLSNSFSYPNILISQIQIGQSTSGMTTSSFLVFTNTGGQKASVTQLQGSGGDDVFSWNSTQTQITAIKGGSGFDTLFLPTGNLNNAASTSLSLSGIDQIDLRQASPVANQLSLSLGDLMQADNQTLVVRGESVDTLAVTAAQTMTTINGTGTSVTVGGKAYATDAQGKVNLASGGDDKFAVYRWTAASATQYLLVSEVITQAPVVTLDTTAPTLSGAAPTTALSTVVQNPRMSAGETIRLTVTFDGPVNGLTSGNDASVFTVASVGVNAAWAGVNGSNTRTLTYTVQAGQNGQAAINETALKAALVAGMKDAAGNAFIYTTNGGAIANIDSTALPVIDTTASNSGAANQTPLVLDLNGDGVHTTALQQGVVFDVAAKGQPMLSGWTDGHDGLLALDLNGDGKINDGAELFGNGTDVGNGKASDGYAALAQYDLNADGVIDAKDAVFAKLQVWVDGNVDAVTDAGELHSLASLDVASLNLQATPGTQVDNGNTLGLTSNWTGTNGVQHDMADVWFASMTLDNLVQQHFADAAAVEHETMVVKADTTTVDNHTYELWNNGSGHALIDQNLQTYQVL